MKKQRRTFVKKTWHELSFHQRKNLKRDTKVTYRVYSDGEVKTISNQQPTLVFHEQY